jgi:hypothetical protein
LDLDEDKVYSIIPFISANNKPDEPYIILSQSFLITIKSNPILISKYINDKIMHTLDLYNIETLKDVFVIFKFKAVDISFEVKNNKFC